ncbi:hypothetical protein, partial [Kitasatospora sp. SC0581]|uniref:hypothetical protein n=1 Tax=Kitasatospora sp. SC0581 TaxID=3394360 RepID=UPI003A856096
VLLGLNQSMMQLAIAAGAGVGGIAVKQGSLASVTWVGAIGGMIAIIVTIMTSRSNSKKKLSNTA